MRNLIDVINEIISISPYDDMNLKLNKMIEDIGFIAPELMKNKWNETYDIIMEFTYPCSTITDCKILSIWSTIPYEKILKNELSKGNIIQGI